MMIARPRVRAPQTVWGKRTAVAVVLLLLPVLVDFLDLPEAAVLALLHHGRLIVPLGLVTGEESGVPLPIPGDGLVAYLGNQVAAGAVPYGVAFGGLLLAVVTGSSLLYAISARWGNVLLRQIGRYLHLREDRIASVERRFARHGAWCIIIGRHIPGLRTGITVVSGVSGVPYPVFLLSTLASTVIWVALFLSLGIYVGPPVLRLIHAVHWYGLALPTGLIVSTLVLLGSRRVRRSESARTGG